MDPVVLIVVPGFLGGVLVALLLFRRGRRQSDASAPRHTWPGASSDVINMARIRVAGVGGLGLVAMALAVAWSVPRIGQTLAVGLILGAVFAAALILSRRRTGPLPSSGRRAGANTTLSIDAPAENVEPRDGSSRERFELASSPHRV